MSPKSELANISNSNYRRWKQKASRPFSTPWFSVLESESYYSIEHIGEQVMILAIVEHSSILLVKAKRSLLDGSVWELPAGGMEKNEKLKECASRELLEETGVKVSDFNRFQTMPSFVLASNRMPMFPKIFHIKLSLKEYEGRLDSDDEIEKVGIFNLEKIKGMISTGELFATLPIAVISRYIFLTESKK